MDADLLKELTGESEITEHHDYGMPKSFSSSDTLFINVSVGTFLYHVVASHQASLSYRSDHPKSRILPVGVVRNKGCTL